MNTTTCQGVHECECPACMEDPIMRTCEDCNRPLRDSEEFVSGPEDVGGIWCLECVEKAEEANWKAYREWLEDTTSWWCGYHGDLDTKYCRLCDRDVTVSAIPLRDPAKRV